MMHMRSGDRPRLNLAVSLVLAFFGVFEFISAAPAGASFTNCYANGDYAYGGFTVSASQSIDGVQGDINYLSGDFSLSNTSYQHASDWFGALNGDFSAPDSADWLQGGYTLGVADGKVASSTQVFAEATDNLESPTMTLYPALNTGNRWFMVYNTGETGDGGRGLYYSTYSLSNTFLADSYLTSPSGVAIQANIEGYAGTSSYPNCPTFRGTLFGTNGNESSPSWSSTTKLGLDTSTGWYFWTPALATTANEATGPYSTTTYVSYDAFKASG